MLTNTPSLMECLRLFSFFEFSGFISIDDDTTGAASEAVTKIGYVNGFSGEVRLFFYYIFPTATLTCCQKTLVKLHFTLCNILIKRKDKKKLLRYSFVD